MKHQEPTNKEILKHLSEGLKYKEIASKVFLSKATVRKRIESMRSELNAKNNTELIVKVTQVLPITD